MSLHSFDSDYFENGVAKRISLYENFRWLPHVSFPMANTIKKLLPDMSILDFGCAKGFTVYALRLLNVEAYGYDISDYALENCKREVSRHLFRDASLIPPVDAIFVKDVLEHISYKNIREVLIWIHKICKETLIIVPLGKDEKYRIKEYGFDVTHIIKEDEEWWAKKFIDVGFSIKEFYHHVDGIKDNWVEHNKFGNGVFLLKS